MQLDEYAHSFRLEKVSPNKGDLFLVSHIDGNETKVGTWKYDTHTEELDVSLYYGLIQKIVSKVPPIMAPFASRELGVPVRFVVMAFRPTYPSVI